MIRPASAGDVPVIHQLIGELARYEKADPSEVKVTPEQLQTALFGPDPAVFAHVAEDEDGTVAGFALWFRTFSTWEGKHGIYLEDLYVRPERRGGGHGRALLAALAKICVDNGYRRLEWAVLDWNEPAIGFYQAMGALPMDEWTVHRLTGDPLRRLGETAARDR